MATDNASISIPSAPPSDKRYFSVEEANRALPYVSRIVGDVTAAYGRIVQIRRELEGGEPLVSAAELEREYDRCMDRLSGLIDELHDVGVELKDFEKGLVDFPALHDDREVLLCWKRGEKGIAHWHEVDAGFAGRRPVSGLG